MLKIFHYSNYTVTLYELAEKEHYYIIYNILKKLRKNYIIFCNCKLVSCTIVHCKYDIV